LIAIDVIENLRSAINSHAHEWLVYGIQKANQLDIKSDQTLQDVVTMAEEMCESIQNIKSDLRKAIKTVNIELLEEALLKAKW